LRRCAKRACFSANVQTTTLRRQSWNISIVYLKNGDRVTGEIKDLIRGEMRLKTDTFGTIYVKWQDVERIKTDRRLQVEQVSGQRYFGPALADNSPDRTGFQAPEAG